MNSFTSSNIILAITLSVHLLCYADCKYGKHQNTSAHGGSGTHIQPRSWLKGSVPTPCSKLARQSVLFRLPCVGLSYQVTTPRVPLKYVDSAARNPCDRSELGSWICVALPGSRFWLIQWTHISSCIRYVRCLLPPTSTTHSWVQRWHISRSSCYCLLHEPSASLYVTC
jgi:hypothetical protein